MATITKIKFVTDAHNRAAGGNIDAVVTWSEDVMISGVPVLNLVNDNAGPGDGRVQHLEYVEQPAPDEALFRISLGADARENGQNGDHLTVGENAMNLNGGSVRAKVSGEDASITNNSTIGTAAGRIEVYTPA